MTRAAYSQWACLAISNTMKSTLTSFTSSLLPGRLPGPPKARHSHLAAPDQLCLGPPPLTTITRQQWFPNAPIVHRKNPSPDPSLFEVSFHNKRYNQPNQFGASRRPNKLRNVTSSAPLARPSVPIRQLRIGLSAVIGCRAWHDHAVQTLLSIVHVHYSTSAVRLVDERSTTTPHGPTRTVLVQDRFADSRFSGTSTGGHYVRGRPN